MFARLTSALLDARSDRLGPVSEGIERQLVELLFTQRATLITGGLAMPIAGAIGWLRTGQRWLVLWSVAMLIVLALRLAIVWAFHRRRERDCKIRAWRLLFVAGAWLAGALWGGAALTIATRSDPFVQMFVISIETVVIMGAAARNASSPLAAGGQAFFGLAPLFVACVATQDGYYEAFSVYIVFAFLAAQTLVQFLYDHHLRYLCMNEENVALVGKVQRANLELAAANRQLEYAATTDSLTGIANRRHFDSTLVDEVKRAQRGRSELALFIIDVDLFKGFNDLYGHQAGDAALQRVAATLSASLRRPGDLVARYGGEEFAAILPHTGAASALSLAKEARRAVEGLALVSAADPAGVLSVSIGVASFVRGPYGRLEEFIRRADEALYAAKAAGRNCVRVARGDVAKERTDTRAAAAEMPYDSNGGRRGCVPPEVGILP